MYAASSMQGLGQVLWIAFKHKYFEELKYKIQMHTFSDIVFQLQIQTLLNCITLVLQTCSLNDILLSEDAQVHN